MTRLSALLAVTLLLARGSFGQNPPNWNAQGADASSDEVGLHCEGAYPPNADYVLNPPFDRYHRSPRRHDARGGPLDLLKICARQDWGGSRLLVTAGAFCHPLSYGPDIVLFDRSDTIWSAVLTDIRLALYCRTHCWCTGGRSGPRNEEPRQAMNFPFAVVRYYLDTESSMASQLIAPPYSPSPRRTYTPVDFISWNLGYSPQVTRYEVSGPPRNRIVCEGPNTPFANHPYGPLVYGSLLELCAAGQFGGNIRGNAGGYCKTQTDDRIPLVEFSSEFAHPLAIINLSILTYCAMQCFCEGFRSTTPRKLFDLVLDRVSDRKGVLRRGINPVLALSVVGNSDGTVKLSLQHCREGGSSQCDLAPVDESCEYGQCLYSELGIEMPGAAEVININPIIGRLPLSRHHKTIATSEAISQLELAKEVESRTCSSRACIGPDDCGVGCVCRVGSTMASVQQIGLGQLFERAFCAMKLIGFNPSSGLGKRTTPSFSQPSPGPCVCNSTYVSVSCCDADDGLVWEEETLRLGSLA